MDSEGGSVNPVETLGKLWELSILLSEDMAAGLAERGLTRARGDLLMRVLLAAGPPTLRELADALKVTPRNVTGLVDALARDGYLRRRPHATDRRATLIELTEQGATTVQRMFDGAGQLADDLLGGLDATQLAGLDTALEQVLARGREVLARRDSGAAP